MKNEGIFHACPDDLKYFEKCIQDTEDSEIKLLSRNSRIYKTAIRSNTPALTWNAKCKYNKQCNSTYKLTIPSFPSDKENYVKVIVQRFFHHHHEGKKDQVDQIRGNDRGRFAQEIINDGSSAHNYYINELGRGKKAASEQTLRKILSENKNKNLTTTNWITNLLFIEQIFANKCKGGYIRSFKLKHQFSMCLFQQNQLECIKNVKPKCRKGFADATGGLCRILKKVITVECLIISGL